ncbi:protein unc-13 homolog [Zingiber officinale]|uniref:protein unc-13 homolog n=1 Tax=Zingiber officinale TaxID=94328 RepID=UPI001C4D2700|nr:protein unc-13 homolog [Zingiber officinale]
MGYKPNVSSDSDSGDLDLSPAPVEEFGCSLFGSIRISSLSRADLREAAYELFFLSCRSSSGSGSRGSLNYYPASPSAGSGEGSSPRWPSSPGMTVAKSRIKKALGLTARRSSPLTTGMARGIDMSSPGKVKRPMTSAEIMRQQMRVTEQNEQRLRKTLTRTLVGQRGRKAESIVLPLELLRQIKPADFNDLQEYHQWQRRQLNLLEAGLLLHPSLPIDSENHHAAARLSRIVRSCEAAPLDTGKNSEVMRSLCSAVTSLAWRSPEGSPSSSLDPCYWADGYPLNSHLYIALLRSVFDLKMASAVLDEVDELVELMKKTWPVLGFDLPAHNACFAWLFFERYLETGQTEPELMWAALSILGDVAVDAKKPDRQVSYVKLLAAALGAMRGWAERRTVEYHQWFGKDLGANMGLAVALSLATSKIIMEDDMIGSMGLLDPDGAVCASSSDARVDYYIRSSMRSAFTKILERGTSQDDNIIAQLRDEPVNILLDLARSTEELAVAEKKFFSPVLKKWNRAPTAAAAATLHACFGVVLKQYASKATQLTNELVEVLKSAGKLEKLLVQMVVDDSADSEDGGMKVVREMIPYDVASTIASLLKAWIEERTRLAKECLNRAKETESWMPRSKSEPYAQSAVDLARLAKESLDEFFDIQVEDRGFMVQDLVNGLDAIFQEYISFVAGCGSKQTYMPSLPPLTRCNQDSSLTKLLKRASPRCRAGIGHSVVGAVAADAHRPHPCASRGTQRLYIRLNTLHYILVHLGALDKSLSFLSPSVRRVAAPPSRHFDGAGAAAQAGVQHVAEVAACRLVFLDTRQVFYEGFYVDGVTEATRIRPALRVLKQNLALLASVLIDRAQPLAARGVMRAALEGFLMVLLAGGRKRAFVQEDHEAVAEDLRSLKLMFGEGEGLLGEETVEREAEVAEGVVALMELPTERLIEEFRSAACESGGIGVFGERGGSPKLPMPPTTGRWNRSDPNTILRVLCHRDDDVASQFLKRAYQLPKRR